MGVYRIAICKGFHEGTKAGAAPKKMAIYAPDKRTDCPVCGQVLDFKKDWWIDYYIHGRKKREKIGTSRTLAEQVYAKRRVEIAENKYLDVKKEARVKFADFADEYLEGHCKPNNKGWQRADAPNLASLKKYFGGRYLHEITPQDIEHFRTERMKDKVSGQKIKKGVSRATVNRILNCMSSLYNRAIEWGKAESNPVSKVRPFKVANRRTRYLEKEEIERLLDCCAEHLRPIVLVALHTGMRKSELLGLKWHDIDIKRGVIHLLNTKNSEKREVPMNEIAQRAVIGVLKNPESQYVFCNNAGKAYGSVKKSFSTACEKAGIINFRFHDLRHTFASQLVMSGVDLNTVRELLGHKDIKMTLRYSHLSPDHKKRAVDVLGKRIDTRVDTKAIFGKDAKNAFDVSYSNDESYTNLGQ